MLSLRKFADKVLAIYLDNEKINIFDPVSKKLFISGIYDKPNWKIEFEVNNLDAYNLIDNIVFIKKMTNFAYLRVSS